jgi:hypothetical protein
MCPAFRASQGNAGMNLKRPGKILCKKNAWNFFRASLKVVYRSIGRPKAPGRHIGFLLIVTS